MGWIAFLVKEINFDVYLVLDFQRHIHPHTHLRQLARNTSKDMEVMMMVNIMGKIMVVMMKKR